MLEACFKQGNPPLQNFCNIFGGYFAPASEMHYPRASLIKYSLESYFTARYSTCRSTSRSPENYRLLILNRTEQICLFLCLTSFFIFFFHFPSLHISSYLALSSVFFQVLQKYCHLREKLTAGHLFVHKEYSTMATLFFFHYAVLWTIKLLLDSWAFPCFFNSWYLKTILKI